MQPPTTARWLLRIGLFFLAMFAPSAILWAQPTPALEHRYTLQIRFSSHAPLTLISDLLSSEPLFLSNPQKIFPFLLQNTNMSRPISVSPTLQHCLKTASECPIVREVYLTISYQNKTFSAPWPLQKKSGVAFFTSIFAHHPDPYAFLLVLLESTYAPNNTAFRIRGALFDAIFAYAKQHSKDMPKLQKIAQMILRVAGESRRDPCHGIRHFYYRLAMYLPRIRQDAPKVLRKTLQQAMFSADAPWCFGQALLGQARPPSRQQAWAFASDRGDWSLEPADDTINQAHPPSAAPFKRRWLLRAAFQRAYKDHHDSQRNRTIRELAKIFQPSLQLTSDALSLQQDRFYFRTDTLLEEADPEIRKDDDLQFEKISDPLLYRQMILQIFLHLQISSPAAKQRLFDLFYRVRTQEPRLRPFADAAFRCCFDLNHSAHRATLHSLMLNSNQNPHAIEVLRPLLDVFLADTRLSLPSSQTPHNQTLRDIARTWRVLRNQTTVEPWQGYFLVAASRHALGDDLRVLLPRTLQAKMIQEIFRIIDHINCQEHTYKCHIARTFDQRGRSLIAHLFAWRTLPVSQKQQRLDEISRQADLLFALIKQRPSISSARYLASLRILRQQLPRFFPHYPSLPELAHTRRAIQQALLQDFQALLSNKRDDTHQASISALLDLARQIAPHESCQEKSWLSLLLTPRPSVGPELRNQLFQTAIHLWGEKHHSCKKDQLPSDIEEKVNQSFSSDLYSQPIRTTLESKLSLQKTIASIHQGGLFEATQPIAALLQKIASHNNTAHAREKALLEQWSKLLLQRDLPCEEIKDRLGRATEPFSDQPFDDMREMIHLQTLLACVKRRSFFGLKRLSDEESNAAAEAIEQSILRAFSHATPKQREQISHSLYRALKSPSRSDALLERKDDLHATDAPSAQEVFWQPFEQEHARWPDAVQLRRLEIAWIVWSIMAQIRLARSHDRVLAQFQQGHPNDPCTTTLPLHPMAFQSDFQNDLEAIKENSEQFRRVLRQEKQKQADALRISRHFDQQRQAIEQSLQKAEQDLLELRHKAQSAELEAQAALYQKEIAQALESLEKKRTSIARLRRDIAQKRQQRAELEKNIQEEGVSSEKIRQKIARLEQQILRKKNAGNKEQQQLLEAQATQAEQESLAHRSQQKQILALWEIRIEESEIAIELLRQEILARKSAIQAAEQLAKKIIQQANQQIPALDRQIRAEHKKRFWKRLVLIGCALLGAVIGSYAGNPVLGLHLGLSAGSVVGKAFVDKDWQGAALDLATESSFLLISRATSVPRVAEWIRQTQTSSSYNKSLTLLFQEAQKALASLPMSLSPKEKRLWLQHSIRRLVVTMPDFAHRSLVPLAFQKLSQQAKKGWQRTLLEAAFDLHQKALVEKLAAFPLLSKKGLKLLAAHHSLHFLRNYPTTSPLFAELRALDQRYRIFPTPDELFELHLTRWSNRLLSQVKSLSGEQVFSIWTHVLRKTKRWNPTQFARLSLHAPRLRTYGKQLRTLRFASKEVLYPLAKANVLQLSMSLLPIILEKLGYRPQEKADLLHALFFGSPDILQSRFGSWVPILRALLEQDAIALVKGIRQKLHEKQTADAWKAAVEKAEASFRQTLASALSHQAEATSVATQSTLSPHTSFLSLLRDLEKDRSTPPLGVERYQKDFFMFQAARWLSLQERIIAFQKENPAYHHYLQFLILPKEKAVALLASSLQEYNKQQQEQRFLALAQELRQKLARSSDGWAVLLPEAKRRIQALYPRSNEVLQKQKLLRLQTLSDPSVLQRLYTAQMARFQKRLLEEKERLEKSVESDSTLQRRAAFERFRRFVQEELPRYVSETQADLTKIERQLATVETQKHKKQLQAEVQKQEGSIRLQKARQAYLRYQQSLARTGWMREILTLREQQASLSLETHEHHLKQRLLKTKELRTKQEEMELRLDEANLLLKGGDAREQIAQKRVDVREIMRKIRDLRQQHFRRLIKKKRLQIATLRLRLRQRSTEQYPPPYKDFFSSTWSLAALQDLRAQALARMGESLRAAHGTMRCLGFDISNQSKIYYGKDTEHFPLYMQNQLNAIRSLWTIGGRGVRCKDRTFFFDKPTRYRQAIEIFQETGTLRLAPSYEDLHLSEEERNIKIKDVRFYLGVASDPQELETNTMSTEIRLRHPLDQTNLIHWRGRYLAELQGKQPPRKDSVKGQINLGAPLLNDTCSGATYQRFEPPADVGNSLLYLSPFTRWEIRITAPKSKRLLRHLKIKSLRIRLFYLD